MLTNWRLPETGTEWPVLQRELDAALASDPARDVNIVLMRPHDEARANAYAAIASVDGGYDWETPAARMVVDELNAMVRNLFGASSEAPVALTSGGTESNFLAVKAARDWARVARPSVAEPEMVMPYSAHPSLSKAAHYLGLSVVRTPLNGEYRADTEAMSAAITEDTILLVASVPSDSHGMCDAAREIAAIAERLGLWCHVDACIGGYLIPFLNELGHDLPAFDFAVPGVRSLAADLHKFGYAPTGISSLLLREAGDDAYLRFCDDAWDGPALDSDRFAGTRSFDTVAGAWVTMRQLGHAGYREHASRVQANTARLAAALSALEGITLLNRPEAGMIHFGAADPHKADLATRFKARRHRGNVTVDPPGFLICAGPEAGADDVEIYLDDLATTLAEMGHAE